MALRGLRRGGRTTKAQARALATLGPKYITPGIEAGDGPTLIEIGFGMGQVLLDFAASHPDWQCFGIDVYRPGIGAVMAGAERGQLQNIRIVEADAREALGGTVAVADVIAVFFPDPWPKKRHHKRRLVNAEFARVLARALRPGGRLLLATDWRDYAMEMLAIMDATAALENIAGRGKFAERAEMRPPTRFEERGRRLGHDVWDLAYRRRPHTPA